MQFLILGVRPSKFDLTDKATGQVVTKNGFMVEGLATDGRSNTIGSIFVDSSSEHYPDLKEFNIFTERKLWFKDVEVDLFGSNQGKGIKFKFVKKVV